MLDTDRIRRRILLHASRDRVWRALSDAGELGTWFGMRLEGELEQGATLRGTIVPTAVDPTVARLQAPYAGLPVVLTVDLVEYERALSFRWHPHAVARGLDYSSEPTTVVVFELEDAPGGVLLTVTEWGFDRLPPGRREAAYVANEGGWGKLVTSLEKYLEQAERSRGPVAPPPSRSPEARSGS
jgi:uncharacterized protein YndB with AHSA1/START domain